MTQALAYYPADLHIHTVLSACAEIEMIPPLIMRQAVRQGLKLIAVTDHNSVENARAMMEAGARVGVAVLPGMEVQTREEVHLLCLFDQLDRALAWQEQVYERLPNMKNREEVFGSQLVVDADGEFIAFNDRLLLTSTSYSVEDVFQEVERLQGIVVPAHVDRPAFGIISQLGLIPAGLPVSAVEITSRLSVEQVQARFPQLSRLTFLRDGDAHQLSEMQNRTMFKIMQPTVEELRLAFAGREGRKVIVD